MDEITTLDEALAWLEAHGYNTGYCNPEGFHFARRIDWMQYSERYGKEVMHYEWCRSDAEVIELARRKQYIALEAAAPDLYEACKQLLLAFDVGDMCHTTINGRGYAPIEAARKAVAKAEAAHV